MKDYNIRLEGIDEAIIATILYLKHKGTSTTLDNISALLTESSEGIEIELRKLMREQRIFRTGFYELAEYNTREDKPLSKSRKHLTGSNSDGNKILKNGNYFSYGLVESLEIKSEDKDKSGCLTTYKFQWRYCRQEGYANFTVRKYDEDKIIIEDNSRFDTLNNSLYRFSQSVAPYNCDGLMEIFQEMLKSIGEI